MSAPTIGRIVHYRARGSADGHFAPECRAAVVTQAGVLGPVTPGEHVSLAVLNPKGLFFDELVEHGTAGGNWHWPIECTD